MTQAGFSLDWSLECLGEAGVDLTPTVYARFCAQHPQARASFRDDTRQLQGRMLLKMMGTLCDLAAGRGYVDGLVVTVVTDHGYYGPVRQAHYDGLLSAFIDGLCEALATTGAEPQHIAASRHAWETQACALRALIRAQLVTGTASPGPDGGIMKPCGLLSIHRST